MTEPRFTAEHVEALRRYGERCFGLQDLTDAVLEDQLAKIRRGEPDLRAPAAAKVFEIHTESDYCGDVTLTEGEDGYVEVSVLVFARCSGKDIAREALGMIIRQLARCDIAGLEAIVRPQNPYSERLHRILLERGFILYERFDNGAGLYRRKSNVGSGTA